MSVSETIVLLNDVLMCAWPIGMFFFGLRRPRAGVWERGHYFLPAFFLPATCMRLRALAGARVGLRLLAAHGQAAAVAQAAVAADLLQALDVLRALAAQVALDREVLVDRVAQLGDLVLGEVADVGVGVDPDLARAACSTVERPIP